MISLLEHLFGTNPYDGFPASDYPLFYAEPKFNLPEKALSLVTEIKPTRIIEVGAWKGNSVFFMADKLTEIGVKFEMVCVDTWLGSSDMWLHRADKFKRESFLKLKHGYPHLYYQFLANVINKGYQDSIIPFPNTSTAAFRVLQRFGYTSKFIYIDASHDEVDVTTDISNWWQLVEEGGLLVGDDYSWPGVRAAVNDFIDRSGRRLEMFEDEYSWWIRKS